LAEELHAAARKQPRFLQMLDSATCCPLSEASPAKGIDAAANKFAEFGTSRWQLEA
jgi:hypothetical protein